MIEQLSKIYILQIFPEMFDICYVRPFAFKNSSAKLSWARYWKD